ncbi:MAG TPA: tetratricopeptide repeat protein [Pyrinomonadaceae bacterium]|nr:tetratricopeptide repeat protein [Pyrinomonadaceae bacterium]
MKQLTLLLVFMASTLAVAAQTQETKSATETKSRARTVASNEAVPVEKDIDNTTDPVTSLRDEISSAATAADRNRLQLKLADLLLTNGNKTEALAELQLVADSNAFDPIGFYNLGNSYARLGETDAAISAYRTAIEQRKGRYSRALNNLGVLLLRIGRWDEAYNAFASALKIESFRYAEASYNLGRLYSARGQNDLAVREWRRALAVNPQHDAAAQALARAGTEGRIVVESKPAKSTREVKPAVVKVAEKSPAVSSAKPLTLDQNSFDYLQRGRSAFERGKMTEAVTNFQRVVKLQDGYFAPANLELSFALISLQRLDEAQANLLEVTKRDGVRYPISYFHLARIYEMKGELKLAEAAFSQAVTASAPTNPQFLLDLSRVREKMGDFKGALEAFESFLKQGQKPAGSDQRLAELRAKATPQN